MKAWCVKFGALASVILALVMSPALASAQGKGSVNVEVGARVGLGDWADASGPGLGATLGVHYALMPELALTGRVGYFWGLPRTDQESNIFFGTTTYRVKTNEIPILLGARYFIDGGAREGGLFVGGELGLVHLTAVARIENEDLDIDDVEEDSEVEFGAVIGGGYDLGKYDFHLGMLWIPQSGDDLFAAMVTFGFDVAGF